MLCPNCHANLPDDALFCAHCSAKQTSASPVCEPPTPEPIHKKTRSRKRWIAITAVAATAVIAIVAAIAVTVVTIGGVLTAGSIVTIGAFWDDWFAKEEEIPSYAMVVNDAEISEMVYRAHLYLNFYTTFYESGLYQYESYGIDPWEQSFPYGKGDNATELKLSDYIVELTKDDIIRAQAVREWSDEEGIAPSTEEITELEKNLQTVDENDMLVYGFDKTAYTEAYINHNMREQALFYGLYSPGGSRAPDESDIRAFYDDNFVAYACIYADDANKPLRDLLEDFEKGVNVFVDVEPKLANTIRDDSYFIDQVQSLPIQSLPFNKAAILTIDEDEVLVTRLDPLAVDPENYENSLDLILYGMFFDEFNNEVSRRLETTAVEYNDRLLDEIKPEAMVYSGEEQDGQ